VWLVTAVLVLAVAYGFASHRKWLWIPGLVLLLGSIGAGLIANFGSTVAVIH
jgi:hypothetical protein